MTKGTDASGVLLVPVGTWLVNKKALRAASVSPAACPQGRLQHAEAAIVASLFQPVAQNAIRDQALMFLIVVAGDNDKVFFRLRKAVQPFQLRQ